MSKRETVQNPLTSGEIRDFHIALLAQCPLILDPAKVRADLKNKTALGRALGDFLKERYAIWSEFPEVAKWVDLYRRHFGIEVDLSNLHVAAKPDYPCWPIVMVPSITNNQAFDACHKVFGAWRYENDLNTVRDIVKRPEGAYVVWIKQTIEADPDLENVSATQIAERQLNTLTLRERPILELKYWDETKQHLDINNWTLCAGSRDADGYVPSVGWDSLARRLGVSWYDVGYSDSRLRARAAVSE
jgi:hypothetical protein